jgi:ABC-type nitrate/sulfonate/bicarbonate transport system permease component
MSNFNDIFKGLFDTEFTAVISLSDFLLCLGAALAIGIIMALSYTFRSRYTKSFVITLATLPAVVCVVIMMVNGNVGTGVAVAGAFSLVRFPLFPVAQRR